MRSLKGRTQLGKTVIFKNIKGPREEDFKGPGRYEDLTSTIQDNSWMSIPMSLCKWLFLIYSEKRLNP